MSKLKLLLADDSITIQKVVNLTFADEGMDVICVGDGNSAMDKIREESPDLVMADVNMPGLNGYEVCEKVKSPESGRAMPVILLVGSFEPFDEAEAKRVGADDYLTKPFQSINHLVTSVTGLLDSGRNGSDEDSAKDLIAADTAAASGAGRSGVSAPVTSFGDTGFDDEMIETDQLIDTEDRETDVPDSHGDRSDSEMKEAIQLGGVSEQRGSRFQIVDEIDTAVTSEEVESVSEDQTAESPLGDSASADEEEPEDLGVPYDSQTAEKVESDDQTDEQEPSGEIESGETESGWAASPVEPESSPISEADSTEAISLDETNLLELSIGESGMTPVGSDSLKSHPPDRFEGAISDEMIEEISRRVMENLSKGALKNVAMDMLPDLTDRVVRRIAEEKMDS